MRGLSSHSTETHGSSPTLQPKPPSQHWPPSLLSQSPPHIGPEALLTSPHSSPHSSGRAVAQRSATPLARARPRSPIGEAAVQQQKFESELVVGSSQRASAVALRFKPRYPAFSKRKKKKEKGTSGRLLRFSSWRFRVFKKFLTALAAFSADADMLEVFSESRKPAGRRACVWHMHRHLAALLYRACSRAAVPPFQSSTVRRRSKSRQQGPRPRHVARRRIGDDDASEFGGAAAHDVRPPYGALLVRRGHTTTSALVRGETKSAGPGAAAARACCSLAERDRGTRSNNAVSAAIGGAAAVGSEVEEEARSPVGPPPRHRRCRRRGRGRRRRRRRRRRPARRAEPQRRASLEERSSSND